MYSGSFGRERECSGRLVTNWSVTFTRPCCLHLLAPLLFIYHYHHPLLLLFLMSDSLNRSLSALSINSTDSQPEDDWDRSLLDVVAVPLPSTPPRPNTPLGSVVQPSTTPRNSVVFPAEDTPGRHTRYSSSGSLHSKNGGVDGPSVGKGHGKRTLSELLKLHSEKGCGGRFSQEEASRIADVLGQWVRQTTALIEMSLLNDSCSRR